MSTLRLLISDSYDPWFNLAVEECIFRQMPATQRVLFLWRNADTVVIGRAQNPWKECNTRRMEEDNVRLARRSSGGGAVFHDLGNTCFTFMAGKPEYDKTISTSIVLNALNALGVSAEASGRNDLVVKTAEGDRKVSGSAYRETKDRGFHHGTLLLNSDLSRLANYLNPDKKKLAAKGITSVRSRVTNLTELLPGITHEQVCEAITEAFFAHYGERVEAEIISWTKRQTCQTSPKPLPARVAGNGTSVRLRHSRICWMNALPGAAWNCISTLKKAISPAPRCLPTVSTPRRWKPSPGDCKAVCTARICCNRSAKRCWLTSRNRKKSYGSCQRGWQGR